ncbi:MAG: tetraacyldisaccharide 4'-kinase [Planctomycetaceae bacterium]|nr:tetraacyldisaccharide 4'-kinase [Planctomycetaceae bacterium]
MFDPAAFRNLQSGRRHGLSASLLRGLLHVFAWPYAAVIQWRNRRYDRGAARVYRIDMPVVSVGNITLGGTGKTPLVGWLARWFLAQGMQPAVISRGYGSKPGQPNDEAVELKRLLPNVPHLQNPDRVAAARRAIAEFGVDAIVLDDGFQHRRIARHLDIVLLDALEPFGFQHLFPRGMLRESLDGLRRADVVAISRADLVTPSERETIWRTVERYAPQAIRVELAHRPQRLRSALGCESTLEILRDRPIAAFCGIGNPAGFRRTVESLGGRLVGFCEFPDHHRFESAQLDRLAAWASTLGAEAVLCTGKDLAKLTTERLGNCPLWAVEIELDFLAGRDEFEGRLHKLLANRYSNL